WLYAKFIALDANFCLCRKNISSEQVDPGLSKGWSYFVEETSYKTFIEENKYDTQECSTCSGHNAVNMANSKKSHGLAMTSVGAVVCACHKLKLPSGTGDLQKGERYVNMDFLFFSSLCNCQLSTLIISYDIACQWSRNLWQQMIKFPSDFHLAHEQLSTVFLIPKFHLPAHISHCQVVYSFNFTPHVGCTDGEAPEHGWANINPAASSTKKMGPGTWQDTLNDYFGDWNWKCIMQLGQLTLQKLIEAMKASMEHDRELRELKACIEMPMITEWQREISKWECDNSKCNPYEICVANFSSTAITQASIQLELTRVEASELQARNDMSPHPEVSAGTLISSGLELEEQQRLLKADISSLSSHPTDNQLAKLQEHVNVLKRCINNWQSIQLLYIPSVAQLRDEDVQPGRPEKVKEMKLYLPSEICDHASCPIKLCEHKWKLCEAQAHEALHDLHHFLHLRTHLYKFKVTNVWGQVSNTHAQTTINRTTRFQWQQ
ncbi:hypothetical protein SCLCIDRAFT_112881, partial [Scleroderma citrinum Foug A]